MVSDKKDILCAARREFIVPDFLNKEIINIFILLLKHSEVVSPKHKS